MSTKETLPGLSKVETKADNTARVAKGIIDDEAALRNAKTMMLRTARLEREASREAQPPILTESQPTLAATPQPEC
ncbi:hypothetical protein [Roseovarius sp.]|mgnify:CR=1 FL=1|uniref:hypothetical protein n=1 Tax=Roseovarius sp. TaxID=1486281 RepID=UPI00263353B3|nr:hypothetical protein [Roseovarius sp.]